MAEEEKRRKENEEAVDRALRYQASKAGKSEEKKVEKEIKEEPSVHHFGGAEPVKHRQSLIYKILHAPTQYGYQNLYYEGLNQAAKKAYKLREKDLVRQHKSAEREYLRAVKYEAKLRRKLAELEEGKQIRAAYIRERYEYPTLRHRVFIRRRRIRKETRATLLRKLGYHKRGSKEYMAILRRLKS